MKRNAFSLIELLVVIAIIGILTAISINSFTVSRIKARDVQRKSAIAGLQGALEQYKSANNVYAPPVAANLTDHHCDITNPAASGLDGTGAGDCYFMTPTSSNVDPFFGNTGGSGSPYQGYLLNFVPRVKAVLLTNMSTSVGSWKEQFPLNGASDDYYSTGGFNYRVQNRYYMIRTMLEYKATVCVTVCSSTTAGYYNFDAPNIANKSWSTAIYAYPGAGASDNKIYQVSSQSNL